MHIVVMGAGAVGATYAHFLKRAGAKITFLVRDKYAAEVKAGLRMYRGNKSVLLQPDAVITRASEIKDADQLWLAIPTTGIDDAGLREIAAASGRALVIDLMPDADRRARKIIGEARVVEGGIPFIAYQTPIAGTTEEGRAPGIAYWIPPGAPTPLAGSRAAEAAALLKKGGMSAKVVADVGEGRAFGGAVLMCIIWHIEAANWSLTRARRNFDGAAAEALAIVKKDTGRAPPAMLKLVQHPFVARMGLFVAPPFMPLPLEPYIRYHFTKVGAQSHQGLAHLIARADALGVDAPCLKRLAKQLLG
ncbi:MAG: hypothetical protein IT381_06335 [Deltaproteobacteria bacterium]|nr:hypothetical protein [Deltaproteobacteria bacterium]